jgi:hypothetical protein
LKRIAASAYAFHVKAIQSPAKIIKPARSLEADDIASRGNKTT